MLQNYLKISFRNLGKNKTFSFINIFGLALSMSICMFFILNIRDAYSYDLFHPDSERTYRILTESLRKDGSTETYASSPYPVSRALTEDYSQVELWTPLIQFSGGEMKTAGKELHGTGLFTDASFFRMFGFELAAGDPATALDEPWSIVLTEELAQKFFNEKNPLGQTIEMPAYNSSFKVTGVLKKFPGKTHLYFDALGSLSTYLALEKLPNAQPLTTEWRNYYSAYNYVRLKPGADAHAAGLALADIAKNKLARLELESRDKGYQYTLQPLNSITPGRNLSQSTGNGVPLIAIWFMSILGVVIMLCACFNYTNLTIARSLVRTKEVGVRKVLGATTQQVFWQFIAEAVVVSLLSLLMVNFIFSLSKPLLEKANFTAFNEIMQKADWTVYGWFLLLAVVAGFVAGLLPAAILSKTSPLAVLQKLQNVRLIRRIGLRKALLGFQFTVTLVFWFITVIVWRQFDHATKVNFGINQPRTLLVEMQGLPYGKLSAAFSRVGGVEKVSAISHPMGTWQDAEVDVRSDSVTEKTSVKDYFIDHHYLEHFGIDLAAGDNFAENPAQQKELFAIVNETFCEAFKMGKPEEAVGKTLTLGDSTRVVVRGVVEDFLFKPADYAIEPLLLRYNPNRLTWLNVYLSGTDMPGSLAGLENTWKEMEKERPFSSQFFDETVRQNYLGLLESARMAGFFGGIGMVIACLGLLGMAIYTVETRAKEVSIRKVMGAGVRDLVLLLSKGYFSVLTVAVLLATPLSYLIGGQILQEFAQRIGWSVWLFLPGLSGVLVIAGLTIASQTVRAALANPVQSLRCE